MQGTPPLKYFFYICAIFADELANYSYIPVDEETMTRLWRNFIAGDEEAFSKIYEAFFKILYSYGYHFVSDRSLVNDAIQELFTDLWRLRANLSDTTSVKFYLFRSLRRRLQTLAYGEEVYRALPVSEKDLVGLQTVDSREQYLIDKETEEIYIKRLAEGIGKLTTRQREALRLKYYEGFTFSEAASIMNMNEQSVRNLVQRALASLRSLLS